VTGITKKASNAMRSNCCFIIIFVLLGLSPEISANIRMPRIFSDNMVIQRDAGIRIWGWGDPDESVTVILGDQKQETRTDRDGRWEVSLQPMKAGGPFQMRVRGKNSVEFSNVLIGDVWLCSGQSNMEWPVSRSADPDYEIPLANYPEIRLFTVPRTIETVPADDLAGGEWLVCSPESIPSFSAVAYYFGRHIHTESGVPVGLLHSSWGGTVAETWISGESISSVDDFREIMTGTGLPNGDRGAGGPNSFPSLLFNGMINPITSFAIRGVIWYQGESNAGRAYQYREVFPVLIGDWRKQWRQEAMPFLFVQLANFMAPVNDPSESGWAELREAQAMALSLPSTGMAVAIDIGDADDIHPLNKQDVGKRLALSALRVAYGGDIVHSGPVYNSMSIEGNRIRLDFTSVGSGLTVKDRYGYLKGFAIAGEDGKFHWAQAFIERDQVVVFSNRVEKPVAVRYAWANNPADANLYNAEGLPASPFRTDEWPGITLGVR
jgi:sialate O-acetylesterase